MNDTDLFGQPIIGDWTDGTKSKGTIRRGYAARPGTGPAGETCGSCEHFVSYRRYCKCDLLRRIWTHGAGTDILKKSTACSKWVKPEKIFP